MSTDLTPSPTDAVGPLAAVRLRPPAVEALRCEGVGKVYGRLRALFRFSETFASGTTTAVLGPNGAGKSTLLSLLATLERPTEGRIHYGEVSASARHRDAIRRHIGLVAHRSLLYPDLTGAENLALYSDLYGDLAPEPIDVWIRAVGLEDAADRPVSSYSRGMKQRLALARALVHHPSVVLLDEPLTGLDRAGQADLWSCLEWLRSQGRVVVVVTHHFDAPAGAFDRVVVLERGRVRTARDGGAPLSSIYDAALRHRPPADA